jgi:hypothetical protein
VYWELSDVIAIDGKVLRGSFDMQHHKKVDVNLNQEDNRNRVEERLYLATSDIDWLEGRENWAGLKSVIIVEINERLMIERVSKNVTILIVLKLIRRNQIVSQGRIGGLSLITWVLDMTFGEDASRNRLNDTPKNMALIKHVIFNQLQAAKPHFKKGMSIKDLRKNTGWKDAVLDETLMTKL